MKRRIIAAAQLLRPHNCLGAALATLLGAHLAGGPERLTRPPVWLAAVVVSLVVAACNAVNDLQDQVVDERNRPSRPLPSGRLPARWAARLALVLLLAAFALAWTLDPPLFTIALLSALLGVFYSIRLKSTVLLGNGAVGLLSATTVVYGGLAAGRMSPTVQIAAVLIFLFVFTREILKSIADQEGDAQAGLTTVATYLGRGRSLALYRVFALTFAGAAALPWFLHLAPGRYLLAVTAGSILPTLGVAALLRRKSNQAALNRALGMTKLMWFSGLLALALLK